MKDEVLKAKQDVVQEIVEKLNRAQAMVLVDYRGLNVEQVTDLRNQYRQEQIDYKVYKNTMMRFALKEAGIDGMDEYLTGPNAVAFSFEDPVAAAKVSQKYAKGNDKLVIKAGVVDGKVIDKTGVEALAKLPPKEVLVAQVLGTLNAPITGLATALQGTYGGLVRCLDQVRAQQDQ